MVRRNIEKEGDVELWMRKTCVCMRVMDQNDNERVDERMMMMTERERGGDSRVVEGDFRSKQCGMPDSVGDQSGREAKVEVPDYRWRSLRGEQ